MKINGLRKLLEKNLHPHTAMFRGITPTIWLKIRVNNMGFSALYALHLQVKTAITPFSYRLFKEQTGRKLCTTTNTQHGYLQEGAWLSFM
jgi:hypothetical protein